ncbi:MAG: T9SS type A sorting domain-containing protein [Bacteroidia bacterium]
MKRKITFQVFGIAFLCMGSLSAQSIKRQVISPIGGNGMVGSVYVQQTAGQSYNTNSYSGTEFSIRQGFQQPSAFNAEIIENKNISLGLFPNPAVYSVTLESSEVVEIAGVTVSDVTGKLIYTELIENFLSKTIDCSTWVNGTYFITVTGNKGEKSTSKLIINK